jgi:hypothetical protein
MWIEAAGGTAPGTVCVPGTSRMHTISSLFVAATHDDWWGTLQSRRPTNDERRIRHRRILAKMPVHCNEIYNL